MTTRYTEARNAIDAPEAVGSPVERPVRPLLAPRDWQAIALRDAAELAGTPEGAARLVESKRYGMLADELYRMGIVCDSYAEENQRFHDEIERLRVQVRQADERGDEATRRAHAAEAMVERLLQHCDDPECHKCGEAVCPKGEPLHFHHDGCPQCDAA